MSKTQWKKKLKHQKKLKKMEVRAAVEGSIEQSLRRGGRSSPLRCLL